MRFTFSFLKCFLYSILTIIQAITIDPQQKLSNLTLTLTKYNINNKLIWNYNPNTLNP